MATPYRQDIIQQRYIYHNDVIYNCDDEKITIDYNHEKTSRSAYLIFYKPCGITSNDTHS